MREIYEHVVKKLNRVLETNHIKPPQLNFENLLHVIEMCIAYSGGWHKEYVSWTWKNAKPIEYIAFTSKI